MTVCHDQASNLGSGSNDSSPEVTNHYLEMTECGRNLNYGFIPRPMDKSVIISYQIYMSLITNDSIINFNETKRKEEKKNKQEKKKHISSITSSVPHMYYWPSSIHSFFGHSHIGPKTQTHRGLTQSILTTK